MIALLVVALVVWVVFIVLGFVIKSLVWLAILGIILAFVTVAVGLGKLLTKNPD